MQGPPQAILEHPRLNEAIQLVSQAEQHLSVLIRHSIQTFRQLLVHELSTDSSIATHLLNFSFEVQVDVGLDVAVDSVDFVHVEAVVFTQGFQDVVVSSSLPGLKFLSDLRGVVELKVGVPGESLSTLDNLKQVTMIYVNSSEAGVFRA